MSLRTGTISQQTRASRDHEQNIDRIRNEIGKKRQEIRDLIYLISTLIGTQIPAEETEPKNDRWEKLKKMTSEAVAKLKKNGPAFIRPTRLRVRTTHPSGGEATTQQHMKEDCDINVIVKRHAETGNISHLNPRAPLYMDCTNVTDLQGAIQLVEEAEDNFSTLPADVRKACQNDPVEFMRMIATEEGTRELAQAGLEYLAEPAQGGGDDNGPRTPKPETIPAQQVLPGQPTEKPAETETPPTPQGGK